MTRPRVVVYWHNGRTLGHTAGCAAVMRALRAESSDVELIALTGAYHGLDLLPPDAHVERLPPFRSYDTPTGSRIEPSTSDEADAFVERRSSAAREFLDRYKPDVLLVDHLPWGWRGELTPSIEATRSTRKVLMWRGVLFDSDMTRHDYLAGGRGEWIATHYDAIVVHNDPRLFRLETEYDLPTTLAAKLTYNGYLPAPYLGGRVAARRLLNLPGHARVVLLTMGGGQGAGDIWCAALAAIRPLQFDMVRCVLGPYLEPNVRERIKWEAATVPGCVLVDYEPAMMPWLAAADVVVTAAGAGALGEVLAARANAVAIPRQLREAEQSIHSAILAERGWIRRVGLADVTAESLREQIRLALRQPVDMPEEMMLGGAAATARKVLEMVAHDR
ncbi:glycosyltransferase [Micromonosporaceae bacterium B7E4]